MRLVLFCVLLAGLACVSAYPSSVNLMRFRRRATISEWIAPGPTDKRGPCPFINLLANHGALPRNGMGISKQALKDALGTLGISWPLTYLFSTAFTKFLDTDGTMRLDLMVKPVIQGGLEHFGSMSRADVSQQPDQTKPNLERVLKNLENMGKSTAADDAEITLEDLLKARTAILAESETLNPKLKTDPALMWSKQKFIGLAETCLVLGVGGGKSGKLTKKAYTEILGYSRLPAGYEPHGGLFGSYGLSNAALCLAKAKWHEGDFSLADAGHFGSGVEPKVDPEATPGPSNKPSGKPTFF